jgi:hypothetical protein
MEWLKVKALSSSPSTTKKKKKKSRNKKVRCLPTEAYTTQLWAKGIVQW